jgi:hypothetical protein
MNDEYAIKHCGKDLPSHDATGLPITAMRTRKSSTRRDKLEGRSAQASSPLCQPLWSGPSLVGPNPVSPFPTPLTYQTLKP